jgi:hypothetical protein
MCVFACNCRQELVVGLGSGQRDGWGEGREERHEIDSGSGKVNGDKAEKREVMPGVAGRCGAEKKMYFRKRRRRNLMLL